MPPRSRLPAGHEHLSQILFAQGFGERRVCDGLVLKGLVQVRGEVVDDPDAVFPEDRLELVVDGLPWVTHVKAPGQGYTTCCRCLCAAVACSRWAAWTRTPRACCC
jgi:hypothetical protein